ncbi:hypothetical protein EYF80_034191 [Liparis tanakae]|uniref:Uncharacterized protein n=1 Tax=Liparis tanakae TaxID=230148 RepID=A0A4Z2GSK3_9TELE|nr:hypothetical protein EYF80_034191 [Liparis tanakae]
MNVMMAAISTQQSPPNAAASQHHAGRGAVIGRHSDAPAAREHFAELGAEAVVQPGVEERIAAGRAHGAQVAEQLDEQKVALVDQVDVDVAQHVEHADRHPADAERRHHQAHQAEGLAFAHALSLRLALGVVAGDHAVAQLDGDAQVGDAERRQRQDVGDEEGAVGVGQPLALLAHPELLADGEALVLELHVVGVSHGRSHQAAGQQPDGRQQVLPINTDSGEREDRHVDRHRLDEVHQVAHEAAEHPAARVEGVGQCEGDTCGTHQHVREGQVSEKKVGDVVHLTGAAYDIEEQVVAEDAHQSHQGVAGDDERLEGLQQLHVHELGAAPGGGVLQRHLEDRSRVVSVCLVHRARGDAESEYRRDDARSPVRSSRSSARVVH